MPLIRSISGLRGTIADGSLSEHCIVRHVQAYASLQPDGIVVIGRDGRITGEHLASVAIEALLNSGRTVLDLGIVPTPTVEIIVDRTRAAGGIIITASHNDEQWNGLKFLDSDGTFLSPERAQRLWIISDRWIPTQRPLRGSIQRHSDPIGEHVHALDALPMIRHLRQSGALYGIRITIDAVNASGSRALPLLIEWLGGEAVPVHCDGSGTFPHPPEPLPEHLRHLQERTPHVDAQLGLAVDPDADRLVLVHSSGAPISEEKTIVLAVEAFLRHQPGGSVVINASTTQQVEDVAHYYGSAVYRSAVGEINVIVLMRSVGAVIGGEGSGGVILPAIHWGRDSLVGTALVLSLMVEVQQEEWDRLTLGQPYVMLKRRHHLPGNFDTLRQRLVAAFADASSIWNGDGIRFVWDNAWLHIRPSNTEPIIRLIAEAPTTEHASLLLERAEVVAAQHLGQ